MELTYQQQVQCFKALSDETRLQIIEMLTMGELCACKILEKFQFTQPTLSYHMKNLTQAGLVYARKEGKWTYYSLNEEILQAAGSYFARVAEASVQKHCLLCGKSREEWEKSQCECCKEEKTMGYDNPMTYISIFVVQIFVIHFWNLVLPDLIWWFIKTENVS